MLSCLPGHPTSQPEHVDRKDRLSSAKPLCMDFDKAKYEYGWPELAGALAGLVRIPETDTRYCRIGQGLALDLCHCYLTLLVSNFQHGILQPFIHHKPPAPIDSHCGSPRINCM